MSFIDNLITRAGKGTPLTSNEYDGNLAAISDQFDKFLMIDTVPTTATDTGVKGQAAFDSSFLYICVATDTWVRTSLSSW